MLLHISRSQRFILNAFVLSGKDSCNGDSGGPLFAREQTDDPWIQIGLVSYGTTTCGIGVPGVYTKVSYYMDWIDGHLKD